VRSDDPSVSTRAGEESCSKHGDMFLAFGDNVSSCSVDGAASFVFIGGVVVVDSLTAALCSDSPAELILA
jgi:hypothetical protein